MTAEGDFVSLDLPCIVGKGHRVKDGQDHCWLCGLIFPDLGKVKKPGSRPLRQRQSIRSILAESWGAICFYCGHELVIEFGANDRGLWHATLDHKIPRCQGGSNHISNLVLACGQCNGAKGDLTLDKWASLGFPKRRGIKAGTFIPVEMLAKEP